MNEYIERNRAHWDEVTPLHFVSEFYDVASFKAGRSQLLPVELSEVGSVQNKTMLHLQCHFGMDTLSWARAGAVVTGVDFSHASIETARSLSREVGVQADFVEANVYDLPSLLEGQFDIVFASYGVVCWLPDLSAWAKIAAGYVEPGGIFYLIDGHPLLMALDDEAGSAGMVIKYPYLATGGIPQPYPPYDGSYADRDAKLQNRETAEFTHDLGEVVTALLDAGLQPEILHEWPFAAWQALPHMTKSDDGYWRLPADAPNIPFMFSVRARKPL